MKENLIYIAPNKSTFIKKDILFLEEIFNVKTQDLSWGNALKLPWNLILQLFFLLQNIKTSKVIVISFGGYFSLLPVIIGKIFKVKTLMILNGTESVSFPEYNYGSLRKKTLKFFIKYSLINVTEILPVDASLIKQTHTFDKEITIKKQGYKSFFPNINTPFKIVPNGFDTEFWRVENSIKSGFITVAAISNRSILKLKGIDLFIEMAKMHPNENFTIVGVSDFLREEISIYKNIDVFPFMEKEKLKDLYAKHQFYVQLSLNEGFGCSLAEAMLSECIPIISNTGALPNVVNDSGFVVKNRIITEVNNVFEEAIKLTEVEKTKLSIKARKRIVENFPISNREQLLLQEIEA